MSDDFIIRASSTPSYQDCGRRTAARAFAPFVRAAGYELRQMTTPVGPLTGTATHVGVAFSLTAKMQTGESGNETESVERGLQSFDDAASQGVLWDDSTNTKAVAHKQIRRQILVYRQHVLPRRTPVAVEERLTARIAEGFLVSGQKDYRIREPRRIVDLKTGIRRRINLPQYGTYVLIDEAHGLATDEVEEDFIQRVKPDKPQPAPQSFVTSATEAKRLAWSILQRMMADLTAFRQTGDPLSFMPNPNSMICSPKYCPAWGTAFCTAHRKE